MIDELNASKSPLETIKTLFKYYVDDWEEKNNETIVDEFYGSFLVDVAAELKEKFPRIKPFIQKVTPPNDIRV